MHAVKLLKCWLIKQWQISPWGIYITNFHISNYVISDNSCIILDTANNRVLYLAYLN